ncbi:MAG: replication restart helicase PriA [Anaerovoracaceae bacterium]|jgi:primosomal protein N' (replication factor Y)
MEYANVIINNSSDHTDNLYTYGSKITGLKPGDKVYVPFAKGNRIREAYVYSITDRLPEDIKGLKYIIKKDSDISLSPLTMELCGWMRERYFCRYIDAVKCFIPAGKSPKRRKTTNLFKNVTEEAKPITVLTTEQKEALEQIRPYIHTDTHRVFLIHGVTNSGKTEVYMQVIGDCIARGKTAIMLVPEISLTAQTIQRFIGRFGSENIAVLHSKLTSGERYDQWMRIKQGKVKIVIGARSAVFAPFDNIGIIILDEEHETTYKSDMTPKYDTAEVAIRRASLYNGVVLLGSATPSLETSYRADLGKFQRIQLTKRYNQVPLPIMKIVDMREELLKGNKSIFSIELYREIKKNIEEKKQVILFLNRRGYSAFLSCRSCGYVMRCKECNISLTYHKAEGEGICHYCGYKEKVPVICPECGSKYIKHFGTGTEKVEEMAAEVFPKAVIDRLDMDAAKRKGSTERILSRFAKGKTDILIGTQLVAKGLDFANVGLVGIISADISLNIPDYRSSERTFQLITQAAGRAGRRECQGKVVIQTYTPKHYAIQTAAMQNYKTFYDTEIIIRKQIGYPPFSDLIQVILSADSQEEAELGAERIKEDFLQQIGNNHYNYVLGPKPAPLNKVNGLFRYQIVIKCLPQYWELYKKVLINIKKKIIIERKKEWFISIDVNPYGFL